MLAYRIDFESLPWETAMEGVRQKVFTHSGKKVRLVEYSRAIPPHWCTKGHYGYILKGRLEIEFGDAAPLYVRAADENPDYTRPSRSAEFQSCHRLGRA